MIWLLVDTQTGNALMVTRDKQALKEMIKLVNHNHWKIVMRES